MVKALTAITVLRLRRTYQNISDTRQTMENIINSINSVFQLYPSFDPEYLKKLKAYIEGRKQKALMKTVLVFMAAQQDLYGDLIFNIGQLFISELKGGTYDAIVIGKVGKKILEREGVDTQRMQFYDLSDDRPDMRVISQIIEQVLTYERVVIFHGKSESMTRQSAEKSEIFKDMPQLVKFSKRYLFEPEPEEIFKFLESRKSALSLHQKVYESQYTRLAAKRWNWIKQQLARGRLLEELTREYLLFKKSTLQKQQQVTIFAHRQMILDNPNIKNTAIYGW